MRMQMFEQGRQTEAEQRLRRTDRERPLSGAGFGAVLGILLWGTGTRTSVIAFVCGMASVGLAYYFSRSRGSVSMMSLVLSGIIISSIFSALISLVKYVADPYDKLPAITYWLMGSLGKADFDKIQIIGLPMIAAGVLLIAIRWRINILSLGCNTVLKVFDLVRRGKHLVHIGNQRLARLCQDHAPPAFLKKRYARQLFQLRDVERDRRRRVAEETRRLCKAARAHDCPERREYF